MRTFEEIFLYAYANLRIHTSKQTAHTCKHRRILVKVRSQHINADNCGYSHIHKSENTDFYQYLQMFGDVSQKFEDI